MNVGVVITMRTHCCLVVPFLFPILWTFRSQPSSSFPLQVSLTGRGLIPQFPIDSPSYCRRSYPLSLSFLLGSCSPRARQPPGHCLGPCHLLSSSKDVVLRSFPSSFSLAVFGRLFQICHTSPTPKCVLQWQSQW